DSLIEALAGFIVLWRFATARASSGAAERRAQQLIAISFYLIAAYIAVEATRTIAAADHPQASWVGIGLSAFTLATMPPLAAANPDPTSARLTPLCRRDRRGLSECEGSRSVVVVAATRTCSALSAVDRQAGECFNVDYLTGRRSAWFPDAA